MKKNRLAALVMSMFLSALLAACGTETPANEQTGLKKEAVADTTEESQTEETEETAEPEPVEPEVVEQALRSAVLAFTGDMSLSEGWPTTVYMDSCARGIYDCISAELIERMQAADILVVNNEFEYTTRGEKLPGKAFCFRANPERLQVLRELGMDVAGLANNHVYDYGPDGFADTICTLREAAIPYVGAGENLEEAKKPLYLDANGIKVAFVAASRAEKNRKTPQATESDGGILLCYEPELLLESIEEAKKEADYVICLVHWGTEYSTTLEEVQLSTAKLYLDAGADAIIGTHSHCLQGIQFYGEKPIFYSLGNFWFNEKDLDTMLVELQIRETENGFVTTPVIYPARQKDCKTTIPQSEEERQRIVADLEKISIDIKIDEEGIVSPKESDV